MRVPFFFFAIAICLTAQTAAKPRYSWNKIRFAGGPVSVKPERFDWNTTLVITNPPGLVSIDVAPATIFAEGFTLRLKPEMILSLAAGAAAWRTVNETPGCRVSGKSPALFGLLAKATYLAIVYETAPGKKSALLLETRAAPNILDVLKKLANKPIEEAP